MTGVSADTAGIANWQIKRDWRRFLEQEIRSEGYDLFTPNLGAPDQPPTTDPITLIAFLRRPNGRTAVIVATQTTLWRYYGLDDALYDVTDYSADGYTDDSQPTWLQIGDGFSVNGRRWEAVSMNGWLCLNNAVDLPVTYRVEDLAVEPIWELREQGIACVGTIAEHRGMLVCGDITQIKDGLDFQGYGTITDPSLVERFQWRTIWSIPDAPRRFGAIIPCTITPGDNKLTLKYAAKSLQNGQQILIVGGATDGNNLTTTASWIEADGVTVLLTIAEGDGITAGEASVDTVLIAADTATSVTGKYEDLQGDGGAILKALTLRNVLVVYKETEIFIGQYTGDATTPFQFQRQDILPSTALYHRDTLISMEGAGHFDNGYTLGGAAHIYAGRDRFYRFDLVNFVPMELPQLQECSDVFFEAADLGEVFAADNPITKEVWFCFPDGPGPDKAIRLDYRFGTVSTTSIAITAAAAVVRPETGMVVEGDIWFAMGTLDGKVLRYGLLTNRPVIAPGITVSKAGNTITASGAVFTDRMVGWSVAVPGVGWFAITGYTDAQHVTVLGDGTFTAQPFTVQPAIYHRNQQSYDSVLQSGLDAFGTLDNEKQWTQYTPILSSKSSVQTPLALAFRRATNPTDGQDVLSTTLQKPLTQNLVTLVAIGHYLGDRITVSGVNNPVSLAARIFNVTGVSTHGFVRRQT